MISLDARVNGKKGKAGPGTPPLSGPVFDAAGIQLQRRMRFNPLRMLDPEQLGAFLDQFDIGILNLAARLWDAMVRRDDTLSFLKGQLEDSIASKPWGVFLQKDADPTEAARHKASLDYFYGHLQATDAFDRNVRGGRHLLIRQMMSSASFQYAAHHIMWRPQPGLAVEVEGAAPAPVIAATMEHVPLMYFENTSGTLRFLPMGGYGIQGQDLDWDGEWLCTTGQGIMFAASICYVFKRLTFQDWTIFNERYAQQKVVGMTNAQKDSEPGRALADIVANFNSDQGIALFECGSTDKPPISLLGPEGTASVDLFERFLERQDRKLTVMYRGSDLANMSRGKDVTGVSAQTQETERLEMAHCQRIADAMRQLDRMVIRFCFGEGVEPLANFGLPDMDDEESDALINAAGFLADRGALVDTDDVAERLGVTLTENEEDALQGIGNAAAGGDPEDETQRRKGAKGAEKTANARGLSRLQQLVEEALRTHNTGFDPNEERDENGRWMSGEVVLPDAQWPGGFAEKRDRARGIVRQLQPVVNDHKGFTIHFNRNTAKKTYSGKPTDHEFQSAQGLRKIVKHAEWKSSAPDYSGKAQHVAWHSFETPVRIGDAKYRAELTVKETTQGKGTLHALHLHRLQSR